MYKKALLAVISTALILGFVSPFMANAAEVDQDIGLALRPAIIDLPTEKGSTVSASIYIQNISGSAIGVEVGSQSLIPNDATIDQQKRKDTDASTWMINKGKKLLLAKDEQRLVDVQFLVPEDAGPGGHYALVTFTVSSNTQQSASGSVVTPTLSSLALINVAGEILEEATIEPLDMPFFVFGDEQTLEFDISNTGNVHILPTATVKLYDRGNQLVESIPVPPQLILPNTTKSFSANWSTENRVGVHRVEVDVAYGSPQQYASLSSGTIILMPDAMSIVFGLSLIIILVLVFIFILKNPLRRLGSKFSITKYRFRFPKKKKIQTQNRPQDMARLSMEPGKIDELLSVNDHSAPKPKVKTTPEAKPSPKPKKKKRIVQ